MAHIVEDLAAGLEVAPQRFPNPGEKWRHYKEGKEVEILFLDYYRLSKDEGSQGLPVCPPLLELIIFPLCGCHIPAYSQCVVYACGEGLYVRTVENFLERFEDGVYRFERV